MEKTTQGLIPILERGGERAVSAKDLHQFLEVGRDFSTWIKRRIEKYGFQSEIDYVKFSPELGKTTEGRPSIDYALTLDCAKELSMVENNDKGKAARRYFIEVEKAHRAVAEALPPPPPVLFVAVAGMRTAIVNGVTWYRFSDVLGSLGAGRHNAYKRVCSITSDADKMKINDNGQLVWYVTAAGKAEFLASRSRLTPATV